LASCFSVAAVAYLPRFIQTDRSPNAVAPASQASDQPGDGEGQPQPAGARAAAVGTTARVSCGRGFSGRAASRTTLRGRHWACQRRGGAARSVGRATSARAAGRTIVSGRHWDQRIRGRAAGPSRSDDDGGAAASSARTAGVVSFANADGPGARRAPSGRSRSRSERNPARSIALRREDDSVG
jgi:hypothetical protein